MSSTFRRTRRTVGRTRAASLSVTAAVVAAACGPIGDAPTGTTAVRDSAGVRMVEHTGEGRHPGPWTVFVEPEWRTGWRDDEPTFEQVYQGALLSDGRAVVADGGSSLIYYLGEGGDVVATAGGEGGGPGEFNRLVVVVPLPGDSVLGMGWDMRANVFGPDGGLGRTARLAPEGRSRFILVPAALTDDDRVLMRAMGWSPSRDATDTGWMNAPVVLRGWDADSPQDTVGTFRFVKTYLGPDGYPVTHSTNERGLVEPVPGGFIAASTSDPEIRWYDHEGTLKQVARWSPERITIDDAWWDAHMDRQLARASGSPEASDAMTQRFRRMLESERSAAERVPAFGNLLIDADGNVWIGDYVVTLPPTPPGYVVFAPDGTLLGRVDVPEGCLPLAIATDRLLCRETDEYDVPAVALYRLERRED